MIELFFYLLTHTFNSVFHLHMRFDRPLVNVAVSLHYLHILQSHQLANNRCQVTTPHN